MAEVTGPPERFTIAGPVDVERVRRAARLLATSQGFDRNETEQLCLAVSELATNLVQYSHHGEILLSVPDEATGAIQVESVDQGPGIRDVGLAETDGFSTRGGFGNGLGGVRRMMDDFSIASGPDGTKIVARKWPSPRS
jgi:serine/threonine-protein kinase RsbT